MVAAQYIVLSYVYGSIVAFLLAVLVSPGSTLWPSAVGASFPSRPLYQIGIACTALPHTAFLALWCLRLRWRLIKFVGIARFCLMMLGVYITRADSAETNGTLGFLHNVAEIVWMTAITFATRSDSRTSRYRKYLTIAYISLFLLGLQQLTRFLTSGFGHEEFEALRGIGLLVGIWFDSYSQYDFEHFEVRVNWVESFSA